MKVPCPKPSYACVCVQRQTSIGRALERILKERDVMLVLQVRKDCGDSSNRIYLYAAPPSGKKEDFREEDFIGWMCIPNGSRNTMFDIGFELIGDIIVLRGTMRDRILESRKNLQDGKSIKH